MEKVVMFAWLPCTRVDELEVLMWTKAEGTCPCAEKGSFYSLELIQLMGSKSKNAITNEKLMQTKQHAYIGKIYGGNISSQINQQAYKMHTCGSISPAKSPQDSKFSSWKSLRPLASGFRCYLLGQAITSLFLFITSTTWPPNHPPSAARLMQTASCSQLGVPYPLSKCNPKPRKNPLPPGPLH